MLNQRSKDNVQLFLKRTPTVASVLLSSWNRPACTLHLSTVRKSPLCRAHRYTSRYLCLPVVTHIWNWRVTFSQRSAEAHLFLWRISKRLETSGFINFRRRSDFFFFFLAVKLVYEVPLERNKMEGFSSEKRFGPVCDELKWIPRYL